MYYTWTISVQVTITFEMGIFWRGGGCRFLMNEFNACLCLMFLFRAVVYTLLVYVRVYFSFKYLRFMYMIKLSLGW